MRGNPGWRGSQSWPPYATCHDVVIRAVIYLRQSLDQHLGDADEGLAVARQLDACRALAEQRGWTVVEVVTDNSVSATNGHRPGFARVMALVDQRAVDIVITWAVDRLVRRLADLENVISRCEAADVRLATVSGDIDLSTDSGRLVARILASVARGEVERKSARQRAANRQRAERGVPPARAHRPFGYSDTTRATLVPAEAVAVADACRQLPRGRVAAQHRQAVERQRAGDAAGRVALVHDGAARDLAQPADRGDERVRRQGRGRWWLARAGRRADLARGRRAARRPGPAQRRRRRRSIDAAVRHRLLPVRFSPRRHPQLPRGTVLPVPGAGLGDGAAGTHRARASRSTRSSGN
jgi:DNA invertase Pin-like site-specific DNA recombinase